MYILIANTYLRILFLPCPPIEGTRQLRLDALNKHGLTQLSTCGGGAFNSIY
jgi:hypothetical protein